MCIEMDGDRVAQINEDDDDLAKASLVTIKDLKDFKRKMSPTVPTDDASFMKLLKTFGNAAFATFSKDSAQFTSAKLVITVLRQYSKGARESFSQRTRASILWILLLQSRHFAIGEMTMLAEFTTM